MKRATGIVRKIDELGRVVIPMEIRRTLRIGNGEPLEIFTDGEGNVVLRKFSAVSNLDNLAKNVADAISQTTNRVVLITDRDAVVAAAGPEEEMVGHGVGSAVRRCIASGELVVSTFLASRDDATPLEDWAGKTYPEFYVLPIDGDGVQGTVIVARREDEAVLDDEDLCAARTGATILAGMIRA
ncbi:MAG: stage V sporulation T C-terminal domain-containing protein [Bacillota bacterium]